MKTIIVCLFLIICGVMINEIKCYNNIITRAFNNNKISRTKLYERKRRTKTKKIEDNKINNTITNTNTNTNTITSNYNNNNNNNNDITIKSNEDDNIFDGKIESRLSPIVGSAAAKQAAVQEKSVFKTQLDELLAPTPAGKEPKIIQLAKNITWFSVIVLVLIEIFVSIKTGGAPFKVGGSEESTTSETVIERPRMPSLYDLSPSE